MSSDMKNWDPQKEAFQNRHFNPDVGQHGKQSGHSTGFTVYITGIPLEFTETALGNLFQSFGGEVLKAKLLPPKGNAFRAGFVDYGSLHEAEKAIARANGCKLNHCILKVKHAKTKPENAKHSTYQQIRPKLEKGKLIQQDLDNLLIKVDDNYSKKSSGDAPSMLNRSNQTERPRQPGNFKSFNSKPIFPYSKKSSPPHHPNQFRSRTNSNSSAAPSLSQSITNTSPESKSNSPKAKKNQLPCKTCGKVTSKFCNSCHTVYYCSLPCQKNDWAEHKKLCKKVVVEEIDNDEPLIVVPDSICNEIEKNLKQSLSTEQKKPKNSSKLSPRSVSGKKENICLFGSELKTGAILDLTVTDIVTESCEIVCQNPHGDTASHLDSLQKALNKHYSTQTVKSVLSASVGDSCATVFSEDNQWYRAVVLQLHGLNQALVRYVDYGNYETVNQSKLMVLEDMFCHQPAAAINCKLASSSNCWNDKQVEALTSFLTHTNILNSEVVQVDQTLVYMRLTAGKVCLNDEILKLGNADDSSPASTMPHDLEVTSPSITNNGYVTETAKLVEKPATCLLDKGDVPAIQIPDSSFTTVISHVENPNLFFCQIVHEGLGKLSDTLEQLSTYFAVESNRRSYDPVVGDYCAAIFSEDKSWYRGKVLQAVAPNIFRVFYFDFGNTDDVPKENIQPLPQEHMSLPIQAFKATLANCYPVKSQTWCDDAITFMKHMQNQALTAHAKVKGESDIFSLKINITQTETILDHLIASGLATDANKEESTVTVCTKDSIEPEFQPNNEKIKSESKNVTIIKDKLISPSSAKTENHFNDLVQFCPQMDCIVGIKITAVKEGSFHCQVCSDDLVATLAEIEARLTSYCKNLSGITVKDPTLGMYCAAYFDTGKYKSWYRARILKRDATQIEVLFIDYGNSTSVSIKQIHHLPVQYRDFPMQAISCVLADLKPSAGSTWNGKFVDHLKNLDSCVAAKFISKYDNQYFVKVPHLANLLIKEGVAEYSF